jgi:uncharacterized membrane protein (DUF441 family)
MIRKVIRASGQVEQAEVGDGFQTWNKAIGAGIGTIVQGTAAGQRVELWCDDEALCTADPVQNVAATGIARQPIYGDVIVFRPGDIK